MKTIIWLSVVLSLSSVVAAASETSPVRVGGDLITMISPGYHNFLQDRYSGVSGGVGWVGADVGVLVRLNEYVALEPKIEGYFNLVDVSQPGMSSQSDVNVLGIPALSLKTFLYRNGALELGLNGQAGVPMISSDLPDVDLKRDGMGYAFSADLRLKKSVDIQLGYSYYPIRATPTNSTSTMLEPSLAAAPRSIAITSTPPVLGPKTYNFGGLFLSVGYYF